MHLIKSSYLVTPGCDFKVSSQPTAPSDSETFTDQYCKNRLKGLRKELGNLQHRLYAEDRHSLLVVFQAMDAAGKDSTIRAVMKQVNPAGCQVHSFKQPSSKELDHDFLWRTNKSMPERGRIGIFNRSYYEETLVVRVHPEYLSYQRLPELPENLDDLWQQRFDSINAMEKHMVNNGTVVLKFWLNVSKEEQRKRFLSRLNVPRKYWKFSSSDLKERALWADYMHAYEQTIRATSTDSAPWFAIPADNKNYMRMVVADIMVQTLKSLNPEFPEVDPQELSLFDKMRVQLESEAKD